MPYSLLPEKELRGFCHALFLRYGFTGPESEVIADNLLTADLFGIESHGVQRLIRYHGGIMEGLIDPKAQPEVTFETPLSAVIDAKCAMGQTASLMGMEIAIEKAKKLGFGAVVMHHSNHYGIAGYWSDLAARQDLLGLCFTNTEAIAIPTFGRAAMLGTNPIAVSMPADPTFFHYDIATTVVPRGKLEVYNKKGQPMPAGWAVDAQGRDTDDAGEVIANIIAKAGGGILPLGGSTESSGSHKGYGLGLLVEALTAVMSGGHTSNHVAASGNGDTSETFWALDYGMFGDKRAIRDRMSTLMRELRESPLAQGQERIYVHGDKEYESMAQKLRDGIPANEKTIAELRQIGREMGVDFDAHVKAVDEKL